ncbi:HTTM domain-containing protein [Rhodocytophaga rosea]|uniref:HTTM domain-containing protein n=2 Tax=Rhodocytophaga rosea TaxID=2704465 RepID=A0A6C0GVK6_9BACT|nr:HTTM domain-containing protein [Rhodocytophaga rosea]
MMCVGIIRFWLNDWITELYVKPAFYFSYPGFQWVHPLGNSGMHIIFAGMAICTLLISIGLWYRVASILFFLSFTYVELIDSTNYLNHYYFISLISFLLIFLPANRYFSLDIVINPARKLTVIPLWMVGIIRLQVGLIYFFAGIAKLNPDWLLEALPMKIWLPAKSHIPLIGSLLYKTWVAYLFSWFGAVYDLFIAFFLLHRKTRPVAYFFVLAFHLATALFFPGIGLFPYVMMICSLVFFSSAFHQKLLQFFSFSRKTQEQAPSSSTYLNNIRRNQVLLTGIGVYFLFQILIPFRHVLYPGHLFWHEEGFRFSWRVMLMEKSGNAFFYIKEPSTGRTYEVNNAEFLTPLQEKMMSTQPDMILRYAHHLAEVYTGKGIRQPQVYTECYVALNGKRSRLFIDTTVNLAKQPLSLKHYTWVLPYSLKAK